MNWTRNQISEALVWTSAVLAIFGFALAAVFTILLTTTGGGGSEFIPLTEQAGFLKLQAALSGAQTAIWTAIALAVSGLALRGRGTEDEAPAPARRDAPTQAPRETPARPAGPSFAQAVERRAR